jgi:dTDP-4-amino-4,6-dideoxygalactose transaminase
VTTKDTALAERIKRLRNGGQTDRYHHAELGVNSRLDEVQAAVLRARLPRLPGWTEQRRVLAQRYRTLLAGAAVSVPREFDRGHVYHLFPVRSPRRDALQARLRDNGIETLVHYPLAIPQQPAFASLGAGEYPNAVRAAAEVLSLPLYPTLTAGAVETVASAVRKDQTA